MNMEAFVLKTLKKIKKEAPRRFKDLRDICDELITALSDKEKANGGHSQDTDADQYFEFLELACQTRQPRLMEIALNAIHFLVEHGYLKGNRQVEHNLSTAKSDEGEASAESKVPAPPAKLIDVIIDTVSKCSDETDDGVQLQVIKVLLMAITSLHCEVHEASLLLSVRACFHIHLISKNLINKTTAKAALTQIISVTLQRMEVKDEQITREKPTASSYEEYATASNGPFMESSTVSMETDIHNTDIIKSGEDLIGSGSIHAVPSVTTTQQGAALLFPSVLHKDAYLLFRALCKLSMKGLSEETQYAHNDAIPLQNKILSLELILHILNNSGSAFRTEEKFIYAVRTYLCVSLLSNCTSHVAQVTGLSLQIFVVLMEHFKDHLKHEVEVFVSNIFLRMLESENSTYDHKFRVLEVFLTICRDPKAQVEIFMNYDCDLEAINLFSRIVHGLAKIAKNPALLNSANRSVSVDFMSSTNKKAQQEEHHIRTLGLECLTSIMQSLELSTGLTGLNPPSQHNFSDGSVRRGGEATDPSSGNQSSSNVLCLDGGEEDSTVPSPAIANEKVSNIVDVFDKKQKLNEELDTGILKFNLSPKAGLQYLAKTGHIEMTPKSVADFFHQYQDRLDKTAMGDFLGREREYMDGFCLKVLNDYVDVLDFAAMPFDLAIRHFLGGFRLPGEAQKIDRIMEKFAERYYLQNRDVFASADMAFILAFSTIMLQTNLHNPAIREDKRMTKEQFLKQNKGISADGELPEDLLMEIYDRIAAQPISINAETDKALRKPKKEEQPSFVMFQATTEKLKKDAFNQERKEMVRAGEAMIKLSAKRNSAAFVRNSTQSDEAYARPMFDIVWPPVIGVLSQLLETNDDPGMVQLCLVGFRHSIHISCRLDFPVARNTFINVLLKFTLLDTVKEMRPKHVSCIKLLMDIALSEGDYLEESWLPVLQTVSRLSRLQLLASGSHTDDIFFSDSIDESGSGKYNRRGSVATSDPIMKMFMGPSRAETTRLVEEANAELVIQTVNVVMVDRLFSHSVSLSGPSVRHFVEHLCQVSMLELTTSSSMNSLRGKESANDTSTPRIFSLQKLVEVADYNMFSRSRLDWANMWSLLAKHFAAVGLHGNQNVAMYAIDSLKQLSVKFLQKEELSNFNFQRVFLMPFENIMVKTKSFATKELVLNCIDVMIRSCAGNIHSGWRTIFSIFTAAATQEQTDIASNAFHIVEQIMVTQFELLIYDFVELMNCLVSFVSSTHTTLSLRSLDLLFNCADHLAGGRIDPAVDAQNATSDTMGISWEKSKPITTSMDADASVFRLWWPLLLGLSTSVADGRLKVRTKALDTLQAVLRKHGGIFSPQTLSVIFKGVLLPMIDSAKTDATQQPKSAWPTENPPPSRNMLSWIGTVGSSVLMIFIELFKLFGEKEDDSVPLLPDILLALESCVNQDTESLARLGMQALSTLMLTLGVNAETEEVSIVSRVRTDLVCSRAVRTIFSNLCTDFGDAGTVQLHFEHIPTKVKDQLARCPLAQRRRVKLGLPDEDAMVADEDDLSASEKRLQQVVVPVATSFGVGRIMEAMSPDTRLNVPSRSRVVLEWGATLYSGESFERSIQESDKAPADPSTSFLGKDQPWQQLSTSIMTSMVVSLDFIELSRELLVASNYHWDLHNYAALLSALETMHWHAFCFNENSHLRLQLQQRGFMKKSPSRSGSPELPHLLEQEVLSMEQLLFTVFRLYCHNKHITATDPLVSNSTTSKLPFTTVDAEAFAEPLVERLSSLALMRYLSFEESALRRLRNSGGLSNGVGMHGPGEAQLQGDEDGDSSEDEAYVGRSSGDSASGIGSGGVLNMADFLRQKHEAYKSPALIVLEGMMDFTHQQFQANLGWIVPLLSRLIICEDIEVIRQTNIYVISRLIRMSKLFLDDGANYMHARCEPEYIYYPDESTINEIKYLFVTLKSTELGGLKSNESVIFIKNMPFSYDLAMLSSEGDGNVLSLEDIINSMCRLGTHFISGHDLIQTRANAYIRCKLAGAESVVHGLVVSQSEQSVERDQILLSSATVPSSPRDVNTNHSDCYENGIPNMNRNASSEAFQKVSRASCATPPSTELMLFRSPSVRNEEMNTFPVSVFTMDDESVSAVLNFLPKLEGEMAFISRKAMSSCKSDQLHELWEYFDFDDDGIVTRDDFLLGVSNLAKNYIATDHFTQLLANSYIQRKVRRALFSIAKHQRSLEYDRRESATKKASSFIEDLKNTKYSPGSTVVYTDEEGNNHITKVIRLSNRPMDGQDAYYIETKGVKLYVAASRIRLLNAQDVSALDRADSFQAQQGREIIPSKITEPSTSTEKSSVNAVTSSHTISQEAEIAPIGHSLYTGDSVESLCVRGRNAMDEDITPAIASTPSKGILGYLKSSILGIGGTKASSVVPHANPDTTGNAQCLLSSNLTINEILSLNGTGDVNDADSVVTSSSLLQQTNQGSPLLISPDSMAQSVNIPHSPNGSSGCDTAADSHNANQPTVKPEQGALSVDQCVEDSHGDNQEASVSVASAQTLTTSQRLHTTAAILRADAEVLNVVAKATTTSYKLTRSMYPKPKKVEPYPIYFNRGKNGFFEFNQVDFGVQFSPFMREVIPTQDSRWQSSSESLSETNRCFFLHFGVAMGLHPFALQQCFRSAAAELLKYPENEMTIFFGESLESLLLRNDFVDAQVLTAIWPLEFDRYKILIVRVDHNGRIESFTSFRSELGPLDEFGEWAGEELIFTLQWNHFTILKPKSEQLNKPITAVLAAASMIGIMPLEFITKVDSDPANRFRICR